MKFTDLESCERNLALDIFKFGRANTKERVEIFTQDRYYRGIYVWLLECAPLGETIELYQAIRSEDQTQFLDAMSIIRLARLLAAAESVDRRKIISFLETKDLETVSHIVAHIPDNSRTTVLSYFPRDIKQNSLALIDREQIDRGWTGGGTKFIITKGFLRDCVPDSAKVCSSKECSKIYKKGESALRLDCEKHSCHLECESKQLELFHEKGLCKQV